jgi:hypothetical protein
MGKTLLNTLSWLVINERMFTNKRLIKILICMIYLTARMQALKIK